MGYTADRKKQLSSTGTSYTQQRKAELQAVPTRAASSGYNFVAGPKPKAPLPTANPNLFSDAGKSMLKDSLKTPAHVYDPLNDNWFSKKVVPVLDVITNGIQSALGNQNDASNSAYLNSIRKTTTGNKVADVVLGGAGQTIGFLGMPGMGGIGQGNIAQGLSDVTKLTEAGLTRLAPNLMAKPIVGKLLQGAVESVPFTAQQAYVQGMSPEDTIKAAGTNAVLGGALGGVVGAIPGILKKFKAKIPLTAEEVATVKQTPELLQLPGMEEHLMLEAPKLRTPDVIEGLPPQPTKAELNILKRPVKMVDEPITMGNQGNLLSSSPRLQLKAGVKTDFNVNPHGVADTKPFDQLQLPASKNEPFISQPRKLERPFAIVKGEIKKGQLPVNVIKQSDNIPKYQNAVGMVEDVNKGAPKQALPKFVPNKIPDAADLKLKQDILAKKNQYDAAAKNVSYNVPEQYRKENPFTVSRSTVPQKVQPQFARESLSQELKPPMVDNVALNAKDMGASTTANKVPLGQKLKDPTVGADPTIPDGLKERGFSANTRTDINNPDTLRDSYTANPITYEQLVNKETLAKAQAVFDQGYESARTQLSDLASKMQPEAIPLAKMLSRQAAEAGNMQGAREILSDVAERLTQAGQFSQAASILREADPETFIMTMDKQLKKLNKEGLETYGKKWNQIDLTPEELDMVGKMKRGDQASYESTFQKIQDRIANVMPANAMEKINSWRHIAMLLNPKTQIRNVGGNVIMLGMRRSAKQVSAVLQNVLLKPGERTQVFKIKPEYQQAAADYFDANKKTLLSGSNKYNESLSLNMPNKRVFKNNALEATRKDTYKLLEMGDTPFFKNAYINRLASYAQAKGIKNFSDLGEEAFAIAKKEAEQATYKDFSAVSAYLNKVKNPGKNASLPSKALGLVAEAALPFTKTPINIIKRGVQYSPAGIINGIHMWKTTGAAAAGIDEMAKGLTGTAIMGLGYMLASKGVLTGKAESDADLKAYNANTGKAPFSILGQFTYDWAQPFAVPLSVGVEVYNALKTDPLQVKKMDSLVESNDTDKLMQIAIGVSTGIYNSLAASGDSVFNMSVMKGVKDLIGNPQGFTAGLAQLPQNYLTQYVPTVAGQIAGMVDPTVRQSYVPGNIPASIASSVQAKIPFASKLLPPKQTPFGTDVKRDSNPLNRAFAQFISPGTISVKQDIDPKIDTELRRLNTESGLKTQLPTMVTNYISATKDHPKIDLTPEETTQYQKRVGQLTMNGGKVQNLFPNSGNTYETNFEGFSSIINSSAYKNLKDTKDKTADEQKAALLASIIEKAKAQAKKEILKSKGLK